MCNNSRNINGDNEKKIKVFVTQQGIGHIESGMPNNQDKGFITEKVYGIFDGCSGAKTPEIGAKQFSQALEKRANEITEKNLVEIINQEFWKVINNLSIKELKNSYYFTMIICIESKDKFDVFYAGDGYIILFDADNNISFCELIPKEACKPSFYMYNYLRVKKDTKGEWGAPIRHMVFPKEKYKSILVSSDGISNFVKNDFKNKNKFINDILINGSQESLADMYKKYPELGYDDIIIAGYVNLNEGLLDLFNDLNIDDKKIFKGDLKDYFILDKNLLSDGKDKEDVKQQVKKEFDNNKNNSNTNNKIFKSYVDAFILNDLFADGIKSTVTANFNISSVNNVNFIYNETYSENTEDDDTFKEAYYDEISEFCELYEKLYEVKPEINEKKIRNNIIQQTMFDYVCSQGKEKVEKLYDVIIQYVHTSYTKQDVILDLFDQANEILNNVFKKSFLKKQKLEDEIEFDILYMQINIECLRYMNVKKRAYKKKFKSVTDKLKKVSKMIQKGLISNEVKKLYLIYFKEYEKIYLSMNLSKKNAEDVFELYKELVNRNTDLRTDDDVIKNYELFKNLRCIENSLYIRSVNKNRKYIEVKIEIL